MKPLCDGEGVLLMLGEIRLMDYKSAILDREVSRFPIRKYVGLMF